MYRRFQQFIFQHFSLIDAHLNELRESTEDAFVTLRSEAFKGAMEQTYHKFLHNFLCLYSAQRIEVCVCVHVCCVCIHACVGCMCVHVSWHGCIHVCVCLCVHACVCVPCVLVHACVCMYIFVHVQCIQCICVFLVCFLVHVCSTRVHVVYIQ